jgi:hypothetical protein
MHKMKLKPLRTIGWREWVKLPDLGIKEIKAKIDTGARSSSLNASDMRFYKKKGKDFVKFTVHPVQRSKKGGIECNAEILEFKKIKSSNGQIELRPVINTTIELMDVSWLIEFTLTNRDEMGFRMLLGRAGFRRKFLVDAGKSYFNGKPVRKWKNTK